MKGACRHTLSKVCRHKAKMKFFDLMKEKSEDPTGAKIPTIAFLGDSVTQGCFELYMKADNQYETEFESESAYHNCLKKMLAFLFPNVPVNIINAGISGDNACGGAKRVKRDVIPHNPDLTVVCFGLNDCWEGKDGLEAFKDNLRTIYTSLKDCGSEVICMTPNMMNTYVSYRIERKELRKLAENTVKDQTEGRLKMYCDAAKQVATECGIKVCDVYSKWEQMYNKGVDITELLANYMNHPKKEMHWLFAFSLMETLMN